MRRWRYTLEEGTKLRELIGSDESEELDCDILRMIQVCCNKLISTGIFDEDDIYDIEELRDLIDGDDELVRLYFAHDSEWWEYGFDSAEDLINDRLAQFYDLCDNLDVFVAL